MSTLQSTTGEYQVVNVAQQPVSLRARYEQLDRLVVGLMARYGITLLRVAIGIVYIWFGALKLVHGVSPIENFIREAMPFLPGDIFMPVLAVWEMVIGIGFIAWRFPRVTLALMLMQMGGAMSPLILRPDLIWQVFPYQWTLVGQYIFKDIILITAALVVGATARGGSLHSEPRVYRKVR